MSLVETIISRHAEDAGSVQPADIVVCRVDRIYLQDGNTPTIRRLFQEHGFDGVFAPDRVGVFFDHSVLSPEAGMSERIREAERFATGLGLEVFPPGTGISHVVALEQGWFEPGSLVVGADSHTCTGGALQCLALGMGASDVAAAMVTGRTWLRVPETRWLEVTGNPSAHASPKDVLLYAMSRFRPETFLYRSVEWLGPWAESLSLDGAATVANMAVEMGAKCAFLPPGPQRPVELRPIQPPARGDPRRLSLDIQGLPPFVAKPHSPQGAVPLDECAGQPINYVFVGTCTNGRLEDLKVVADVLRRRRLSRKVQFLVTPGSRRVYLEALQQGLIELIVGAGGLVLPPGCGPCVGTQGSIPAAGDQVLSTMNRNFKGRMGNAQAGIWLASPLVAAYTGLLGHIPHTSELT